MELKYYKISEDKEYDEYFAATSAEKVFVDLSQKNVGLLKRSQIKKVSEKEVIDNASNFDFFTIFYKFWEEGAKTEEVSIGIGNSSGAILTRFGVYDPFLGKNEFLGYKVDSFWSLSKECFKIHNADPNNVKKYLDNLLDNLNEKEYFIYPNKFKIKMEEIQTSYGLNGLGSTEKSLFVKELDQFIIKKASD